MDNGVIHSTDLACISEISRLDPKDAASRLVKILVDLAPRYDKMPFAQMCVFNVQAYLNNYQQPEMAERYSAIRNEIKQRRQQTGLPENVQLMFELID